MRLTAALVYWVLVAVWLTVLGTIVFSYVRNPRTFGTTRLLLSVLAIDTLGNIFENIYFGLYFGGQFGLFPPGFFSVLGQPALLIIPKLINGFAGCVVLGLLLLRWLPLAVHEWGKAEQYADGLKSLAINDWLTGLYNRRHFQTLAHAEFARRQRYSRPLSVLILDVDHFKAVNDRFGHATGDLVLQTVASVCRTAKRASDIVARIGGEEFAFMLPETDEEGARSFAERLCQLISECALMFKEEKVAVTVSIGGASATVETAGIDELLLSADQALYEAKRSGRNRVVMAMSDVAVSVTEAAV